jgi:hypothetical protein
MCATKRMLYIIAQSHFLLCVHAAEASSRRSPPLQSYPTIDNQNHRASPNCSNLCFSAAIAFACAALSIPTTVEDVFHYADLPAQLIIDAGLTLADTYQVACKYVDGRNLPFRVELFFFDEGRLNEQDFAEQVGFRVLGRVLSPRLSCFECGSGCYIVMASSFVMLIGGSAC